MPTCIVSLALLLSLSSAGCSELWEDLDGIVLVDDASVDAQALPRNYWCGYAMPSFNCDNGRSHVQITALDMTSGIAMCSAAKPMPNLDSCHVIDLDGAAPSDESQCQAATGTWRPATSCCNFKGTLSCPAKPPG